MKEETSDTYVSTLRYNEAKHWLVIQFSALEIPARLIYKTLNGFEFWTKPGLNFHLRVRNYALKNDSELSSKNVSHVVAFRALILAP